MDIFHPIAAKKSIHDTFRTNDTRIEHRSQSNTSIPKRNMMIHQGQAIQNPKQNVLKLYETAHGQNKKLTSGTFARKISLDQINKSELVNIQLQNQLVHYPTNQEFFKT